MSDAGVGLAEQSRRAFSFKRRRITGFLLLCIYLVLTREFLCASGTGQAERQTYCRFHHAARFTSGSHRSNLRPPAAGMTTVGVAGMELPWAHLCLLLAASCTLWPATRSFQHVCYLRAENKSLPFAKVDVGLCSHIILGFAAVASDGSLDLDPVGGLQHLASFALLRRRKPDLKLMLSVGGGGGNKNFKKMVAGASRTRRFIFSAVSALRAARLDGLDLDWEFPKVLDAVPFVHLLKVLISLFSALIG
ncbi:hypothetical protein HPB48_013870 [Haemaphysalis longicornis]|uniref:GH18 domain-containing protein n=1 Tax=Haemaphysalis longicornis TaxID=44386 RepID=A0A9J6G5A4_HAELO|nr:hypothetical protein HPB48_013870 [Haemaphysalis longicornis]